MYSMCCHMHTAWRYCAQVPVPLSAQPSLPLVMVLKRSCPAVSQICSLIHLLSSKIFLILKSILQARRNKSATPVASRLA